VGDIGVRMSYRRLEKTGTKFQTYVVRIGVPYALLFLSASRHLTSSMSSRDGGSQAEHRGAACGLHQATGVRVQ
jgi:hypothetical protein